MKKICRWVLSIALATACAHAPKPEFDVALSEGHCEEALQHLNADEKTKFIGRTQRAMGTTLSYAVTGVGYGADVVLTVAGGMVVMIGMCAPAIVAKGPLRNEKGETISSINACLPTKWSSITFPHAGRAIYRSTENWRCPDLTAMARGIRRVALCHETKGGRDGLTKASQTIHSLTANNDFMECIAETERDAVRMDAFRLDNLLHRGEGP